jgi:ribokinase
MFKSKLRVFVPFILVLFSHLSSIALAFTMKAPVAVVGSANQDLTTYTAVLPQMGETVTGSIFATSCGGKGSNQACAAASLGLAPVTMICRMGDDVFAKDLLANFKKKGVQVDEEATILQGVSTGVASIVVDTTTGDNMIIVTPGANHEMKANDVERALKGLSEKPAAVVVQLEILKEAALAALKTGSELGAITILNPAPAPETGVLDNFYMYTDIIIPNETELRKICGVAEDAQGDSDMEENLAKQLLTGSGVKKAVIVTLGARGAMVVARDKKGADGITVSYVNQPDDLPCKNDPIADTIGAGDAFCGALAAYLSSGVGLEKAAAMACGLASMSIRCTGASYPSPDEIPDCLRIKSVVDC